MPQNNILYPDKNSESVCLKKVDFKGETTDANIKDLLQYNNLTSCTIFKFDITEEDMLVFYSLSNLRSISFEVCNLEMEKIHFSPMVERIYFTMCKNLNLKSFNNTQLKQITFIGNRENKEIIDVTDFGVLYNTEELVIHDYKIKNIREIINIAPRLKKLNIDGCLIDDEACLKELIKKVEISHRDEFFYQ